MKRLLSIIALLIVFLAGAAKAQALTITRVIDGDTVELSDGQRVRLIGVDTPEKYQSVKLDRDAVSSGQDKTTIQALGQLASEHARRLVEGKRIELEYDQANAATGHKDRYSRTLAYVWVIDGADRFMLNERLIQDGYANAYTSYPFQYPDRFRGIERKARENNRGLWADDAIDAARHHEDESDSATVYVTKTGTKYHRDGCRHLSRSKIPMSLVDAAARYGPCSVCNPPVHLGSTANATNLPAAPRVVTPKESAPKAAARRSTSVQCSGTTKKGARCKRMTRSPNGRCYQHGGN